MAKRNILDADDVLKKAVREVLGGDVYYLWNAFLWRDTPQGMDHWHAIANGEKRLSKRSRQYLNKLLSL